MPKQIEGQWKEEIVRLWLDLRQPAAKAVHQVFVGPGRGNRKVSLRTVQSVIAEAKKRGLGNEDLDAGYESWSPWTDDTETSEESHYLLKLNAVCRSVFGRPMDVNEARWAKRLRVALDDLSPRVQYMFVHAYALKEQVGQPTSRPGRTAGVIDLDDGGISARWLDLIITYKPWVPGNQVYLAAAAVQLSGPGMFGAIGEASPAQFLAFLFGAKAEHMIDQLLSESSELEGHMGDWGVAVKLLDRIGLPHADKSEPEKVLLHNQARFWSSSISNSERNKFGAQFQAYVTNEERRLIRQMQEDERVKREEKSNESK